jgi:hypothetical protein
METLQDLVSTGRLAVEEKQNVALDARSTLSLLRVELAPGVTEPAHTHPGVELIYGRLPPCRTPSWTARPSWTSATAAARCRRSPAR